MTSSRAAVALLVVVSAASCGDDGGAGPSRDTGANDAADINGAADAVAADVGAADDVAPGMDASDIDATRDAGATDSGIADASPRAVQGGVTVFETRAPGIDAIEVGGVAAGFRPLAEPAPADVIATFGDCTVSAVAPDTSLLPDEPTLDAGAVTVDIADQVWRLAIEPSDDGPRYASDAPQDRDEFYVGGDLVTASAAGGADVPAFSASVVAPDEPVITAPSWTPLGGGHDRSTDLRVAWSGSTSGADVFVNILPVTIFPTPGIAEGNAITCRVDDTGLTTVPAAALAMLPEGGLLGGGSVALTVIRSVSSPSDGAGDAVVINVTASHTIVGSVD